MKGLGDLLERIFRFFGIKKKEGCLCEERQEAINRIFPFKK